MLTIRSLESFPASLRGGAVAVGNFDGVHLGHARLIERLRVMAQTVGGPSVVFTFDPPPTRVLRPQAAPESLIWMDRKIEILTEMGVKGLVGLSDRPGSFSIRSRVCSSTPSFGVNWAREQWSKARTSSSATTVPAMSTCCASSLCRSEDAV